MTPLEKQQTSTSDSGTLQQLEKKENDKWDSFETYKGTPDIELPGWMDWLCKVFFFAVGLAIVFSLCGGLLLLLSLRYGGAFAEKPWMAMTMFIVGGFIGVTSLIRAWKRS